MSLTPPLFAQVGGPHRGGTTLLADLLEAHPSIDGLGATAGWVGARAKGVGGTKGPANEGVFMQSVFSKFGLSMGPLEIAYRSLMGTLRQNGTGWGSYAYAANAHLTEANETGLLTELSRRTLMTEWGRYWPSLDLAALNATSSPATSPPAGHVRRILLEKSPSNIMMWRFLNALWHLTSSPLAAASPDVRFLFISRHPLAVSIAQRSWEDASHLSIAQLVAHWLHQQQSLERDLQQTPQARALRLRFEDLAADPTGTLAKVFKWLELATPGEEADGGGGSAQAAASNVLREVPVKDGTNRKYLLRFCEWVAHDSCAGYRAMVASMEEQVVHAGYSVREWGSKCEAPCAAQLD